jgi:hypothetical protein
MSAVLGLNRRPILPQVTLVAVTSVALDATVAALRRSLDQVAFGRALLLSDRMPNGIAGSDIEWRPIAALRSRTDYSRFILHSLADHVETRHALLVQWDGFVRNGGRWHDEYLAYDYIGAPWPQYKDGMGVGNGGFSLRSRALLEATRNIDMTDEGEDVAICRTYRRYLENTCHLRFADMDVAKGFSYERGESDGTEFGFHGVFNMPSELGSGDLLPILTSLEPGVIGARESCEMLVQAIRSGNWPVARLAMIHQKAHPRHVRHLLRSLGWLLRGHDGWPVPRSKVS